MRQTPSVPETAAKGPPTESVTLQCPLCGSHFSEDQGVACKYCRLFRSCGMVACPRCGHEFPRIKKA